MQALLAWGLFNVLLALILVVPYLLDDRLDRGRLREAVRRLAPFRATESRVPPWEPFAAAIEERRALLSARDVRPRD